MASWLFTGSSSICLHILIHRDVMLLPGKREALVEFENLEDASRIVKRQKLNLGSFECGATFSASPTLRSSASRNPAHPNKARTVLMLTVKKPRCHIDVDVINIVTTKAVHPIQGRVLKIAMVRGQGIQALVEFDSAESATKAKEILDGQSIHNGCCVLSIEFAESQTLVVLRNNKETFDYTVKGHSGRNASLLDKPADLREKRNDNNRDSNGHQNRGGYNDRLSEKSPTSYEPRYNRGPNDRDREDDRNAPPDQSGQRGHDSHGQSGRHEQSDNYARDGRDDRPRDGRGSGEPQTSNRCSGGGGHGENDRNVSPNQIGHRGHDFCGQGGRYERRDNDGRDRRDGQQYEDRVPEGSRSSNGGGRDVEGAVIMVYGLHPDRMNCDRTFNLFCQYGNVVRIKFLMTKKGAAMVQMEDVVSRRRAVDNLNGVVVFGQKLSIAASRQTSLNEVHNPYALKDGSLSYKDYIANRNNRFNIPELAAKNRIVPPSRCLYFFSAPADFTEEDMLQIYRNAGLDLPRVTITTFGNSEWSTSGLVEWDDVELAVEALILTNHVGISDKRGGRPYVYRVRFASPSRPV